MNPENTRNNSTNTCSITIILKNGTSHSFKAHKEETPMHNMKQAILNAVESGTTYFDHEGLIINGEAVAIVNFEPVSRNYARR